MIRLRRASAIAALCVLASAATAHAECAWVLWIESGIGPKAPACANVLIAHVEPGLSMLKSS
jgi:hypothetical protein